MLYVLLQIKNTGDMGRGIFAEEAIPADTIIEEAPVIVMSKADREHLDKTLLHDYIFEWRPDKDQCCMALGHIPIYNHSYKSNCEYFMDFTDDTILIKSVRPIAAGEELTINYNGDANDETPLWFNAK